MTLREIHERCKARHSLREDTPYCDHCDTRWPCADHEDAVAGLAILDACVLGLGPVRGEHVTHRLVPDPEPSA